MNGIVGELVAVVGGHVNGNSLSSSETSPARQGRFMAAISRQGAKMLPPPAKPGRRAEKPKNASPEQVIPLEEGDFKDF
jgi:hypothetical protein